MIWTPSHTIMATVTGPVAFLLTGLGRPLSKAQSCGEPTDKMIIDSKAPTRHFEVCDLRSPLLLKKHNKNDPDGLSTEDPANLFFIDIPPSGKLWNIDVLKPKW